MSQAVVYHIFEVPEDLFHRSPVNLLKVLQVAADKIYRARDYREMAPYVLVTVSRYCHWIRTFGTEHLSDTRRWIRPSRVESAILETVLPYCRLPRVLCANLAVDAEVTPSLLTPTSR